MSGAAVLIVDDNAGKRLALRAMLTPLDHTIVEADSGRAALRAVLAQNFAVILMDVRMPILDGYETAKLIRQRDESKLTPIIFVTAYGRDETETATAYAGGAVDFIFMPVLPTVVRAKVSVFTDLFVQAQALRDSEVRAAALVENVADAIVTTDEDGRIESFNRSAQRLFGYGADDIAGQPFRRLIDPDHHDELPSAEASSETLGRRADGTTFPIEMDVSHMAIAERRITIACIRDISSRRAYTEALEHQVLHDDLTGLPNRTLFGDRVERAIAAADRAGEPRGVLVVDLDEFETINETYGRSVGDGLLQAVADRLRGVLSESDTVARLRGDEFGILPSEESNVEAAEAVAWSVRGAFGSAFLVGDHVIDMRASIGVAFFPQHGRGVGDLLRRADLAMRQAKRSGTGLGVFIAEPEDQTARRLHLLSELRDGILRDELVLHYQPKIELGAARRTTGVEALVRWQHPTKGLLQPAQFMPEAERSELIEPLTKWVLNEALRQQRAWSDTGIELTMAVNISARSLTLGTDLPETVQRLTETWGTAPKSLILELTEIAIIDADAPAILERLHSMGECVAIDDFGTGHSSLVYLQRLPIDQIKVDRSFVMKLASVPNDAVIVRSTIDLAHNLGLTVVAEGVEDEDALDMLVEYGCDSAQGYYFSRPCPADELTAWLAESPFGAGSRRVAGSQRSVPAR